MSVYLAYSSRVPFAVPCRWFRRERFMQLYHSNVSILSHLWNRGVRAVRNAGDPNPVQ